MKKIKNSLLIVILLVLLLSIISCEQGSDSEISNELPKILTINAPDTVELPKTIFPTCNIENSDSIDLQYKWEATSGTLSNTDSSVLTFYTPKVKSEVIITCSIFDSNQTFDQKSIAVEVVLPAFVGSFYLESVTSCDTTYYADNDDGYELLLDVYEGLISQWSFAYAWRVSYKGFSFPDSCVDWLDRETYMGIIGKHGPDEDSKVWMAHPYQQGYITLIFTWVRDADKLILSQPSHTYTFRERN